MINIKLSEVTQKVGKEVYKNIQLGSIDSCRFMASSLDKLTLNLDEDQCRTLESLIEKKFLSL